MAETTYPTEVLNDEQKARIAALEAARHVMVVRGMTSSGDAHPDDLHILAEYIITGQYPLEVLWEPPKWRWWRRKPKPLDPIPEGTNA